MKFMEYHNDHQVIRYPHLALKQLTTERKIFVLQLYVITFYKLVLASINDDIMISIYQFNSQYMTRITKQCNVK